MVELILFALLIAAGFGVIVVGLSTALAWLSNRLFPEAYEQSLALVTAGLVPVGLLLWTIVDFAGSDCCESGPQVQGLLLLMVMHGVLIAIAWPLGYRINRSMFERWRA
jgi:hypothetical protein